MMRHIVFFLFIVAGLYFVNNYESEVDELVGSEYPVLEGSGIAEVDVDGERYDYLSEVVEGTYTVLYFYSNSCPTCRRTDSDLKRFNKVRPDVAIRKFDLGDEWSGDDAYNTYGLRIRAVPFILVYDPDGQLVAEDVGLDNEGAEYLYDWMNAEYRKAWEREKERENAS